MYQFSESVCIYQSGFIVLLLLVKIYPQRWTTNSLSEGK